MHTARNGYTIQLSRAKALGNYLSGPSLRIESTDSMIHSPHTHTHTHRHSLYQCYKAPSTCQVLHLRALVDIKGRLETMAAQGQDIAVCLCLCIETEINDYVYMYMYLMCTCRKLLPWRSSPLSTPFRLRAHLDSVTGTVILTRLVRNG